MAQHLSVVVVVVAVIGGCSDDALPLLPESEAPIVAGAALHQARLADGRIVRAIAGAQPGESELVVDDVVIAAAAGPDDLPLALSGAFAGQVAFVSGRSGIASIWRVDVDSGALVQLTNTTQRIGHMDARFVPPPAHSMGQDGRQLVYDDGNGHTVHVSLIGGGT